MNYIGAKNGLLSHIQSILSEIPRGTAIDLFCGTGVVSQHLVQWGFSVIANDWQAYASIIAQAKLLLPTYPPFSQLSPHFEGHVPILNHLNNLPGKDGRFVDYYCESGSHNRLYFSQENGQKIQAIRDQIQKWAATQLLSETETAWLIGSLLLAADKVANTASVYGAYLKTIKPSARKPLCLREIAPTVGTVSRSVYQRDAVSLVRSIEGPIQLTYIDPPYNHRQYDANYHILETVAQWDLETFVPRGIAGLRPPTPSAFAKRRAAADEFRQLFLHLPSTYVLMSYNNEGILSKSEIESIFHGRYEIIATQDIAHRRFRADREHINRHYSGATTTEYLILGKLRG